MALSWEGLQVLQAATGGGRSRSRRLGGRLDGVVLRCLCCRHWRANLELCGISGRSCSMDEIARVEEVAECDDGPRKDQMSSGRRLNR